MCENEKDCVVMNMERKGYLGDYKILNHVRDSFWSRDYLVEHSFSKKKYVLKVFSHEGVSGDAKSLFSQERSAERLACSPYILVAEEFVQTQEASFFIVDEKDQELIALHQYVSETTLSEQDIGTLASQLATILDTLHERQIFHRGIHPHSVYVKVSKNDKTVFLSDDRCAPYIQKSLIYSNLQHRSLDSALRAVKELVMFQSTDLMTTPYKEDVYSFGMLVYYMLFKCLPIGLQVPLPSKTCSHFQYDWDHLLHHCLNMATPTKKLTSLIVQKTAQQKMVDVFHASYASSIRNIDAHLEKSQSTFSSLEEETVKEFVFVEAKSIDEAMDTSITSEGMYQGGSVSLASSIALKEPTVSRYIKKEVPATEIQPLLTEMVCIEGGVFYRGSLEGQRDEQPKHCVQLQSFFLDIHPVTNEQFVRYLEYSKGEQDRYYNELIRLKESRIQRRAGKLIIEPGYAKHPVVGVTWYGAREYAAWVGKRLPTEAEWEVAASCGTANLRFPCGEDITKQLSNFFSSDTTPIMSYPPNAFGLYDMAGNVYEWCQDWYSYDFYESSSQELGSPVGPSQGVYRVLRGGCWKSLKEDLRCSHRHRNNPGTVNSTYGFRCAK